MAPLSASELKEVLEWSIALAHKAGKIMLEGSQAIQIAAASEDTGINEKKNSVDLVTEYDVKVEELVKKEIAEKYPTFKLYVLCFSCQKKILGMIVLRLLFLAFYYGDVIARWRPTQCWRRDCGSWESSSVDRRTYFLC